ncbi:hypothetical protein Tco_0695820 [Tanacetum coccineum]
MSVRAQTPTSFLSEAEAERFLALTTPPPSPLTPLSSPLPQIPSPPLPAPLGFRAARIRLRDAPPSPVHETEVPEICLPLQKRLCLTAPTPSDKARSLRGMSLRTTVLAQQAKIAALRAVDRARQAQLLETLRLVKALQTQLTALQGSLSTRCEGYIGGYIMKSCIKDLVALHFVYLLWAGNLYIVMSDLEDSTVTYTMVSSPFEGLLDIGSPRVDGPPMMPEDLYAYAVAAF